MSEPLRIVKTYHSFLRFFPMYSCTSKSLQSKGQTILYSLKYTKICSENILRHCWFCKNTKRFKNSLTFLVEIGKDKINALHWWSQAFASVYQSLQSHNTEENHIPHLQTYPTFSSVLYSCTAAILSVTDSSECVLCSESLFCLQSQGCTDRGIQPFCSKWLPASHSRGFTCSLDILCACCDCL